MSYTRDNEGQNKPHRAIVEFFTKAVQNNFKSEQEGRPVFDDKEYVRISTPGDKYSEVVEPAKAQHREQYAREYEAFKRGEELVPEGTPLKEWPPLSPAQVANFRAMNILTVEQLSEIHDGNLDNLGMGGRALRDKARLWLEQAAGGAPISRLLARVEALEAQKAVDDRTIAELAAEVRSRPRAVENAA